MSFYIPIKQEFPLQFNIYIYIYNGNIMELVGHVTINQNILYVLYDGLVIFPSKNHQNIHSEPPSQRRRRQSGTGEDGPHRWFTAVPQRWLQ